MSCIACTSKVRYIKWGKLTELDSAVLNVCAVSLALNLPPKNLINYASIQLYISYFYSNKISLYFCCEIYTLRTIILTITYEMYFCKLLWDLSVLSRHQWAVWTASAESHRHMWRLNSRTMKQKQILPPILPFFHDFPLYNKYRRSLPAVAQLTATSHFVNPVAGNLYIHMFRVALEVSVWRR